MQQRHTILLTGAKGQVGWELRRTLSPLGRVVAVDVADLDLAKPDAVRSFVRELKPSIIVNPAAYTAVDKAESDRDLCHALNAVAPAILAEEAKRLGALFVHYSTDYVFDGAKATPWEETDATHPLGVYGATKCEGEEAVLGVGGASLVFRLQWVYGARGMNFLLRILQLAREREELRIVDDQVGAPTWSRAIAEATAAVVAQGLGDPWGFGLERVGIYHMAAGGRTSWHGFAKRFLDLDGREKKLQRLVPIPSSEYPTPAKRPANSVMSCERLRSVFGIELPGWEEQVEMVMEDVNPGQGVTSAAVLL